ncbi:hypothetical protein GCG54_00007199 [Colletotrichum gloeosporioides]|uniref:Ecp2 effector protein domain-containing protein n=1 Tax=Colletotrichum gloeosporioides TaxID=474922 RepID=A0A8H4CNE7_COLGL|nr:uncharacterized protein GCG54_00007199 [Colletotrichum gloeosporioides]KAF3806947.1 hypothetical protein GCG54_00007199 [Colletotrichum gloeosporioides]
MHANFLFWTLPLGAVAFPAVTPQRNNGVSANIVQRANSAWLEVHTGVSVGLGGPTVGVLPGPVNKATCNLLITNSDHSRYNPDVTLSRKDSAPCSVGQELSGHDGQLGDFKVKWTNYLCGTFGSVCNPQFTVQGQTINAWEAGNCKHGTSKEGLNAHEYWMYVMKMT